MKCRISVGTWGRGVFIEHGDVEVPLVHGTWDVGCMGVCVPVRTSHLISTEKSDTTECTL